MSEYDPEPTDVEAETEGLLEVILPMALELVGQQGGFQPFGVALKSGGETIAVNPYDGDGEPEAEELIELLKLAFRREAENGTYLATAIAFSVYVTPPGETERSEAIAVMLDHFKDYSIVVFQPYVAGEDGLQVGEMFGQDGDNEIFGQRVLN